MARYNKIFAGPVTEVLPQVDEVIATAAILPGQLFTHAGALAVAATAQAGSLCRPFTSAPEA